MGRVHPVPSRGRPAARSGAATRGASRLRPADGGHEPEDRRAEATPGGQRRHARRRRRRCPAAHDWFRGEVEIEPGSGRLRKRWYAVVNDIGLFLGEVMVERSPILSWVFFTKGKKMSAYQRHVIMGFTKVENPDYVDIDIGVATYGVR